MDYYKLIALYYYIYECYNTELCWHCQRFSNNSQPDFTDEELLTIYIFCVSEEEKFKIKSIYTYARKYYAVTQFNDGTAHPPRAVRIGNDIGFANAAVTPNANSDVLVIKATNLGLNAPATKWTYISNTGAANIIQPWTDEDGAAIPSENLVAGDRVIVLNPIMGSRQRVLVSSGAAFSTTFSPTTGAGGFAAAFQPVETNQTHLIYGIRPTGVAPRMPFNRADFYIRTPAAMPNPVCANDWGALQGGG